MIIEYATIIQVALPVVVAAAAWGGTRQALNGTRERVKDINTDLSAHIQEGNGHHIELCQRVTAVETKVDALSQNNRSK